MAELPRAIQNLINAFERLPGVGPKSAARLAFYLLNTPSSYVKDLSDSILKIKIDVKICRQCFSVSETELCSICEDKARDQKLICVVERAIDVMALENVGGFKGVYHVLGGVINPLDHVGPEDLKIAVLIERLMKLYGEKDGGIEVILATNPTMEGEATALFLRKKIGDISKDIEVSRIGSGLPMGADLEFADQATLSRAMDGRRVLR
jgi:recombination protein RecR